MFHPTRPGYPHQAALVGCVVVLGLTTRGTATLDFLVCVCVPALTTTHASVRSTRTRARDKYWPILLLNAPASVSVPQVGKAATDYGKLERLTCPVTQRPGKGQVIVSVLQMTLLPLLQFLAAIGPLCCTLMVHRRYLTHSRS